MYNCQGAWHDSVIADHGVYQCIQDIHKISGGKVVVDLVFALKQYQDTLIKSSQRDPANSTLLLLNRDAMSLRQMLEWGMRMIQG